MVANRSFDETTAVNDFITIRISRRAFRLILLLVLGLFALSIVLTLAGHSGGGTHAGKPIPARSSHP
jgi:hypothetical protein